MNKFNIGDRVKVYCTNLSEQPNSFKGTVETKLGDLLGVRGDLYPELRLSIVHHKQCRKLVKKSQGGVWIRGGEFGIRECQKIQDKAGPFISTTKQYSQFEWIFYKKVSQ